LFFRTVLVNAGGWCSRVPQELDQIVGQLGRRLRPHFEPTRHVAHAVGSRKAQRFSQLAKRRLCVTAAEPSRDGPRRVRVMTPRQRSAVQAVETSHSPNNPFRVQTGEPPRLGERTRSKDIPQIPSTGGTFGASQFHSREHPARNFLPELRNFRQGRLGTSDA
jgi:hypothetical protein